MIADARWYRALVAATVRSVAVIGCSSQWDAAIATALSDGPGPPTWSREELLDLARVAAASEGLALTDCGHPDIHYELLNGERKWLVFYPGKEDRPDNFFSVLIDCRTHNAEVLTGDES